RKDKLKVAQTIILSITQQLKQIKEQVQAIDEQIKQLMEQFDQPNFPDIPGIGDTTKATIISEVGDIEKFESKEKFVSYIGLDPVIHQSGKSTKHKGISKKLTF
ncbi:MAG: transposase, partial [Thermoplasmata archaeon]